MILALDFDCYQIFSLLVIPEPDLDAVKSGLVTPLIFTHREQLL